MIVLDIPVVQLREKPGFNLGNVGSIPIGSANLDGPQSVDYRKRETASGCKSRTIR